MEFSLTKGECYIERYSKNRFELYRILKDSNDLKDVKYESIMVTPEKIYNRGTLTYPEPFHCSSFRKVSPDLLEMIKTECKDFESNVKSLLSPISCDPNEKLAVNKCFTASLKRRRFSFAKVDFFEEISEGEGIMPVYTLDEPGGEIHGEYIIVGNYELHKSSGWVVYDEVFTDKKRCCHVYPSYIFNMIDELMEQRLKYIWNLFNKYLHIIEDVAWDEVQQRYLKSNVRS